MLRQLLKTIKQIIEDLNNIDKNLEFSLEEYMREIKMFRERKDDNYICNEEKKEDSSLCK